MPLATTKDKAKLHCEQDRNKSLEPIMSLESLGSLARTVSDRFLRDNLRRIISGTNVSISGVLDGEAPLRLYDLSMWFVV